MTYELRTNPEEFKRFHELLTRNDSEYQPYYFLVNPDDKDPYRGFRRLTFKEAYAKMKKGFNVGIRATPKDKLVIVDIDNLNSVDISTVKPTLMIQSRKRIGRHFFYFTDDKPTLCHENSAKNNINTDERVGEIRANNEYVVTPGSFKSCNEEETLRIPEEDRINAGKYTILSEAPVSIITYTELPEIYRNQNEKDRSEEVIDNFQEPEEKDTGENFGNITDGLLSTIEGPFKAQKEENFRQDSNNKSAIWDLTIHNVTGKENDPNTRFPMFPELHDSETGGNASVSRGLLCCWRDKVYHNAFSFLAAAAGILSCGEAGYKKGRGFSRRLKDQDIVFTVWKYAKGKGHVPKDDPVPSKAMMYLALENKLCEEKDITEGWKLPSNIYNKVIELLKDQGINPGREHFNKKNVGKSCNGTQIKFKIYFDEVALRVLKTNFIFSMRDNKQLYIYRNGVYKSDGAEAILDTLIRDVHNEMFLEKWQEINSDFDLPEHIPQATTTYVNEVLAFVRAYTHESRADIDKNSGKYVNLKNGMFDLDKWELVPHDPKYISIIQTLVIYDPNAECTQIEKFINEVANPEDINFLYEWFGYCLTTDTNQQRALMVYGIAGTGKSVLLSLLETFIGRENCSAESLQKIEEDKE